MVEYAILPCRPNLERVRQNLLELSSKEKRQWINPETQELEEMPESSECNTVTVGKILHDRNGVVVRVGDIVQKINDHSCLLKVSAILGGDSTIYPGQFYSEDADFDGNHRHKPDSVILYARCL